MRGTDRQTASMFSYLSPEAMVPAGHPLRLIRPIVNAALERLSGEFDKLYAAGGRDSIAPEKLLRALLLQAFYSVRSERQLMEQLTYNMLFRWFVGLSMDAAVWDVTVMWRMPTTRQKSTRSWLLLVGRSSNRHVTASSPNSRSLIQASAMSTTRFARTIARLSVCCAICRELALSA